MPALACGSTALQHPMHAVLNTYNKIQKNQLNKSVPGGFNNGDVQVSINGVEKNG